VTFGVNCIGGKTILGVSKHRKKTVTSLLVATLVIVMGGLIPFSQALAQAQTSETFTVNLNNADIHSLIQTVTERTGKNFIVDPRVRASVTVISSEPVDADEFYQMFLSILDIHGFAAVPAGSFIKIVPATVGVQSAVPVLKRQPVAGDELVTEVIHVRNVPAQQLVEALRPLLPATASFSAEVNSGNSYSSTKPL